MFSSLQQLLCSAWHRSPGRPAAIGASALGGGGQWKVQSRRMASMVLSVAIPAQASDGGDDDDGLDDEQQAVAAWLPDLALLLVLEYVAADNLDDLVSAGQVCRHWRRVAASDQLWRGRRLKSHAMATQAFTRVVLFAPRLLALDVCWINQISPEDRVIRKQALLASRSKLHRLTGVMCHRDAAWTHGLLARHAAHLRELEVGTVDRDALRVVASMHRLRSLHLTGWDPGLLGADPFLYPAGEHIEEETGLERLEVRGLPKETTLSLLQTHRKSLKRLTLNIGTPSARENLAGWPKTCNDLAQVLQTCNFCFLQNVILTRYVGCFHSIADCITQRDSLRSALGLQNVQCSECSPNIFQ